MKPIIVIKGKNHYEFSNIDNAELFVHLAGGTIYRRNDWYEYLQMWLKVLISRV